MMRKKESEECQYSVTLLYVGGGAVVLDINSLMCQVHSRPVQPQHIADIEHLEAGEEMIQQQCIDSRAPRM